MLRHFDLECVLDWPQARGAQHDALADVGDDVPLLVRRRNRLEPRPPRVEHQEQCVPRHSLATPSAPTTKSEHTEKVFNGTHTVYCLPGTHG